MPRLTNTLGSSSQSVPRETWPGKPNCPADRAAKQISGNSHGTAMRRTCHIHSSGQPVWKTAMGELPLGWEASADLRQGGPLEQAFESHAPTLRNPVDRLRSSGFFFFFGRMARCQVSCAGLGVRICNARIFGLFPSGINVSHEDSGGRISGAQPGRALAPQEPPLPAGMKVRLEGG